LVVLKNEKFRHTARTAAVRAAVSVQQTQIHFETMGPPVLGSEVQKLVLNIVAMKVPGKNTSVTADITRMSAL
jgi:hypothetical protein